MKTQQKIINTCDADVNIKQDIIDKQTLVIKNYKAIDKIDTRKIKWLRVQRNVLAVAAVVFGAVIYLHH